MDLAAADFGIPMTVKDGITGGFIFIKDMNKYFQNLYIPSTKREFLTIRAILEVKA